MLAFKLLRLHLVQEWVIYRKAVLDHCPEVATVEVVEDAFPEAGPAKVIDHPYSSVESLFNALDVGGGVRGLAKGDPYQLQCADGLNPLSRGDRQGGGCNAAITGTYHEKLSFSGIYLHVNFFCSS